MAKTIKEALNKRAALKDLFTTEIDESTVDKENFVILKTVHFKDGSSTMYRWNLGHSFAELLGAIIMTKISLIENNLSENLPDKIHATQIINKYSKYEE